MTMSEMVRPRIIETLFGPKILLAVRALREWRRSLLLRPAVGLTQRQIMLDNGGHRRLSVESVCVPVEVCYLRSGLRLSERRTFKCCLWVGWRSDGCRRWRWWYEVPRPRAVGACYRR